MSDSPDEQQPKEPGSLDERDVRDLKAFQTRKFPRLPARVPVGCVVSLIVLVLVFFMILGVCYRG
jgi:hypothetical protein